MQVAWRLTHVALHFGLNTEKYVTDEKDEKDRVRNRCTLSYHHRALSDATQWSSVTPFTQPDTQVRAHNELR